MSAFLEQAAETLRRLNTNRDTGLTSAQVEESRRKYGANQFTRERPPTPSQTTAM